MADLLISKTKNNSSTFLLPAMANRHGVIAGATGTGKTVTLQKMAEQFSSIGVPVFVADVKGDLSGLAKIGGGNQKIEERLQLIGVADQSYNSYPVVFWDVFGKLGHPIRTTVSDMGPLLFSRLLRLNDVQAGVLTMLFKIADDNGLLLLDLKDLRQMITYVGEHTADYIISYGNISVASLGTIQRGLLEIEQQGGSLLFGEPALNIYDFIRTDSQGKGMINILASDTLLQSPRVYSTFLLWLLSELFEELPEVGDLNQPKLVFFFDEAHLLFDEAPRVLIEKIEQVVRLIRSKGVGIFFVTQNPVDIPENVLGQLGNRVQHALRAFTPKDQKAIKKMSETFRVNPSLSVESEITQLTVGEALVSLLDSKGSPSITERTFIVPPQSHIGAIDSSEREQIIRSSLLYGRYEQVTDRESAYEKLIDKINREQQNNGTMNSVGNETRQVKAKDSTADFVASMAKSAMRAAMSQMGRQVTAQIVRGILGSMLGNKKSK